jgi:ABC-type multidrug transport system fused ATPase/permease subunit
MRKLKQVINLLDKKEKKQTLYLFFLILSMAILDTLGVASIMPFIAVLANPELIQSNNILSFLYKKADLFGINTINQFIFFFGIVVFVLLIVSLTIRGLTYYVQIRFALMREYTIGRRLMETYLSHPYTWFLKKHSADLGKNILLEVNQIIDKTIIPIISIIVNGLIGLFIFILLILVDPKLALIVSLILGLGYLLIFLTTKKLINSMGSIRLILNKARFQALTEAFNSIKEVKVSGLEEEFIERYSKPAQNYAKNESLANVIFQVPKFFIEAIAFGSLIILTLILLKNDGNFIDIVPLIALYAFAGYRIIPSLQALYSSLSHLNFSGPSLEAVHKDLVNLKITKDVFLNTERMQYFKSIELRNISYNYPNSSKDVIKNIDLFIKSNCRLGIVGKSGSGKTTIVDILLGLLEPTKGRIYIDGNLVTAQNKRNWQKNIGYIPQHFYLSDDTIANNIAFGIDPQNINQEAVIRASKIANLHNFVDNELPKKYDTFIGENGIKLSGGQRQRIGIARALYHDPKVLILDEATSSLDNITEKIVMESVDNLKRKTTLIIIAHRLSTIKKCDHIILLDKGEITSEGSYEKLLNDENFKSLALAGN